MGGGAVAVGAGMAVGGESEEVLVALPCRVWLRPMDLVLPVYRTLAEALDRGNRVWMVCKWL